MRLGHPRATELGAWFDGEGRSAVGSHVARCARCRRRVDEFALVRSWVRAQPLYRMGAEATAPKASRRRVLAAVASAAVAAIAIAGMVAWGPTQSKPSARSGLASGPSVTADTSAALEVAPEGLIVVDHAPHLRERADKLPAVPHSHAGPRAGRAGPLRVGIVVPRGTAEAAELVEVASRRVLAANAAGGVAGYPVELVVIDAGDGVVPVDVDVLVGGYGIEAPAGIPWLLPAETSTTGDEVLAAEATAEAAGEHLGRALRRAGLRTPVGVIVGAGPDTGLAEGLAARVDVVRVLQQGALSCTAEIATLYRAGVEAVAIAGSPELAGRCASAAAMSLWKPKHGFVFAPSAAYAGLHQDASAWGARTVLSLPWPTTTAPGAARFRATTTATSYRALVTFAATELAIDVARRSGPITLSSIAAGKWPSDLLDLTGTTSPATVVVAGPGGWTPEVT